MTTDNWDRFAIVAGVLQSLAWVACILYLASTLASCGTLPTGIRLSSDQCLELSEQRDGALLAGKVLAGVGGLAPLAAVPDEVPENARWGVGAGAAATASVGVALIWYGERRGEMFEAYCTADAETGASESDGGAQ